MIFWLNYRIPPTYYPYHFLEPTQPAHKWRHWSASLLLFFMKCCTFEKDVIFDVAICSFGCLGYVGCVGSAGYVGCVGYNFPFLQLRWLRRLTIFQFWKNWGAFYSCSDIFTYWFGCINKFISTQNRGWSNNHWFSKKSFNMITEIINYETLFLLSKLYVAFLKTIISFRQQIYSRTE